MKMNAKKLALVLVALLLALTCVFAACKKEPTEETKTDPVEALAKEELFKIASDFKDKYAELYLNLYTDDVATSLEAAKAEALLKIAGATKVDEAQKIAADYLEQLKKAPTFATEVKSLIAKINVGGVALADEADIKLMLDYDSRLNNAIAEGATGAKKTALDNYKADTETQTALKQISARFAALTVAKATADEGVNARIAAILEKTEGDAAALNLKDYETLLALAEEVDAFAAEHDLDKDSDAYAEILRADDLAQANKNFEEKTADNDQVQSALAVIRKAAAFEAAAEAARSTEQNAVWVDGDDLKDSNIPKTYFIVRSTFLNGAERIFPNSEGTLVKVTGTCKNDGGQTVTKSVWVNESDVYDELILSWAQFQTVDVIEVKKTAEVALLAHYTIPVTVDGETKYAKAIYETEEAAEEAEIENPLKVEVPGAVKFRLSRPLQDAAEEAAEAAAAWARLIDQAGNEDLKESIVNRAFYNKIVALLNAYNASLTEAINLFVDENEGDLSIRDFFVVPNYVSEYPVKSITYGDIVLNGSGTLMQRIKAAMESVRAKNDMWTVRETFLATGDYEFVSKDGKVGVKAVGEYPAISYKAWAYKWTIDGEQVTDNNTKVFSAYNLLADNAKEGNKTSWALDKANDFVDWVATYLAEEDRTDRFDLSYFRTVESPERTPANQFVVREFGEYELTFADYKVEEEAIPQVEMVDGSPISAQPTAALDITVYADYNVALALIEKQAELEAANAQALVDLDEAVKSIFKVGPADLIASVRALYNGTAHESYVALTAADVQTYLETKSILVALKDGVAFSYDAIISAAEAIQQAALNLYPHALWNTDVAPEKAKADAAEAAYAEINAKIAQYEALQEAAEADYEWKKLGNSFNSVDLTPNPTDNKFHTEENVIFFTDAEVESAATKVVKLKQWLWILKDATKAFMFNEADYDTYQKMLQTASGLAQHADWYLNSMNDIHANANYFAAQTQEQLDQKIAGAIPAVAQELAAYVHANDFAAHTKAAFVGVTGEGLPNYMADLIVTAAAYVQYTEQSNDDTILNLFVVASPKDQANLKAARDEAVAAYEAFLADYAASFKLAAEESYNDLEKVDAVIAAIDNFLANYGYKVELPAAEDADEEAEPEYEYKAFEYVNLSVSNDYTGKAIDLFSQVYNEKIMARYYISVLLVPQFAKSVDVTAESVEAINEAVSQYIETAWVEAAKEALKDYATSKATFTKVADAKKAIDAAYKYNFAADEFKYEWAVDCINYFIDDETQWVKAKDLFEYLKTAELEDEEP